MKNVRESVAKIHRGSFRILSRSGGAALLLGLLVAQSTARAEYTVTYEQVGANVVATGSGTIDTAALTELPGNVPLSPLVYPSSGRLENGAASSVSVWLGSFTGPSAFGAGGGTSASSGSGDMAGYFSGLYIWLPIGYVSGSLLSDSATYTGETLAGLGMTPGDYTWTWGSGPTADSFNLDIGAVPEPTSVALFGLGGLALLARRHTRNQRG